MSRESDDADAGSHAAVSWSARSTHSPTGNLPRLRIMFAKILASRFLERFSGPGSRRHKFHDYVMKFSLHLFLRHAC